jgi:hypothetical protein
MRGKIIMWTGEKGVVASSGQQFNFDIARWRGDVAPKPDMTVELTLLEGSLESLCPVEGTEVAKETLSRLGSRGTAVALAIYGDVGKGIAIAYGLFAVSALFLPFVSLRNLFGIEGGSIALPGVLSGLENSGYVSGLFVLLLALATIAVPLFWRNRYAPLAFCAPLLITLYADFELYRIYASLRDQLSPWFGAARDQLAEGITPFRLGIGAYLTFIIAAYLAFRGVRRYSRGTQFRNA